MPPAPSPTPAPTPMQDLEPVNRYRTAYILVGCVSVLILIAVGIPLTLHVFPGLRKKVVPLAQQKVLQEDAKVLNTYATGSTLDAQQQYLKSVDEKLSDLTLTPGARNLLLLRKAVVLSDARGDMSVFAPKMKQAIEILKKLINGHGLWAIDPSYNDYALVALVRDTLNCCTISTSVMDGSPMFKNDSYYKSLGTSDTAAALLTLDDVTGQLSTADKLDVMNRINAIDVETRLLLYYGDELNPAIKARLLQELGTTVSEFPTLKPLTYKADTFAKYEAAQKYALAQDVFKSMQPDGKTTAVNQAIDKQYDDAFSVIRAAEATAVDVHGANAELLHGLTFYLESLDRRYGDKVNVAKRDAVIDEIIRLSRADPVLDQMYAIYTKGAYDIRIANPEEAKHRTYSLHFIDLAKTHPNVAEYLKSIGISQ